MISIEGAAVLAQVIPVGLIILAIELGRVDRLYAANRAGRVALWIFGVGLGATVLLNVQAEIWSVEAVASSASLKGFKSALVFVATNLLWIAATIVLGLIIAKYVGLTEMLGRRAAKQALEKPAQSLRQLEYILAAQRTQTRMTGRSPQLVRRNPD